MRDDTTYVLLYGKDPKLLDLRKMILQCRGYVVGTTSSQAEARQLLAFTDINLLVICHRLPTEECDALEKEAPIAWRRTRVLVLTASARDGCDAKKNGYSFATGNGPAQFARKVDDLVRTLGREASEG